MGMDTQRKHYPLTPPDEQLIRDHIPLVKSIAKRFARRLPASVAQDDLLGAGALGLIDSVVRRRGSDENAFACYTRIRIRGAIFDELRAHDWLPRRSRKDAVVRDGEPMPIAVLHIEDLPTHERKDQDERGELNSPLEALANKRIADLLRQELAELPERDRLVLHLHYFKGMRLREIGRFLGVSEARVSQIHHRALRQLRPKINAAA